MGDTARDPIDRERTSWISAIRSVSPWTSARPTSPIPRDDGQSCSTTAA
jgi:hypothetical protein